MKSSTYYEADTVRTDHQKEMTAKVFEYQGNAELTVVGISTGTVYHFTSHRERLEVNYYDSFALMAEPDLKVIS